MNAAQGRYLFLLVLLIGFGLPGMIGNLEVRARSSELQLGLIESGLQVSSTVTPSPIQSISSLPSLTSTGSPTTNPSSFLTPSSLGLYAFIQAPTGLVDQPYVILNAFASIPRSGSIEIRGFVNSQEFVCEFSPCSIFLQGSSRFAFRAVADSGQIGEEVIASVTVRQEPTGYSVSVDSVSQFNIFTDSCSVVWGVIDEENANWDTFVQFPYQLNTKKTLHMLATRLILNGIVDADDCPLGGLNTSLDWPTACGLERASGKMTEWQNQFDEYIWLASRDHGIPPKLLKTLIEVESQFWPGNQRFYLDEFGLGQINQLGVDVLLRRDPIYYQKVCTGVLSDCSRPYLSLEPIQQALIRGAVVSSVDASCASCPYGIDLDKARESVSLVAMLLQANCQQVDNILDSAARNFADLDAEAATATAAAVTATAAAKTATPGTTDLNNSKTTYEDLWRFTFAAYHSGINCFQESVLAAKREHLPVTWENIKNDFPCKGGPEYVDGVMGNLFSFDFYLYEPGDASSVIALPIYLPTRTPVPTPTAFLSTSRIKVLVFMDRNSNTIPDADEWIDAMTVLVATSGNEQITQRTVNGIAIFDMSRYSPGTGITVSLPGLYRSENFILPESGEITVTFMFDQPALPTILP